ncbi:MAG TPA: hypothetical protein PKZ84_16565 [Anaerolineae bacterium]|nr:hypothetical protein [Anaerolineae bacterium]HQI86227.1 hypothetical protein [Anaerolineae bacterium]
MATEEQKKKNLLKVFNIAMYGMVNGLWDLFGESSFATINSIGDKILAALEQDAGLEIAGENPEDILMEVVRLLVDEVGTMSGGDVIMDGNKVKIACQECFLRQATGWLEAEGVQPFACVPMNISAAAMRKRLGTRHRVIGRSWDEATQTCTIEFELK